MEEKIKAILDDIIDNNDDVIESYKPMVYKGVEFRLEDDSDYDREYGYGMDYTIQYFSDGLNLPAVKEVVDILLDETPFVDNNIVRNALNEKLIAIYDDELSDFVDRIIYDEMLEPSDDIYKI